MIVANPLLVLCPNQVTGVNAIHPHLPVVYRHQACQYIHQSGFITAAFSTKATVWFLSMHRSMFFSMFWPVEKTRFFQQKRFLKMCEAQLALLFFI